MIRKVQLSGELIGIAARLSKMDAPLTELAEQLRRGEIEDSLIQRMRVVRAEIVRSGKSPATIDRLLVGIRDQISGVAPISPTPSASDSNDELDINFENVKKGADPRVALTDDDNVRPLRKSPPRMTAQPPPTPKSPGMTIMDDELILPLPPKPNPAAHNYDIEKTVYHNTAQFAAESRRMPAQPVPSQRPKNKEEAKMKEALGEVGFSIAPKLLTDHHLKLKKLLGSGAMGSVFLAEQTDLHADRAVKIITSEEQRMRDLTGEAILGGQFGADDPVVIVHSTGRVQGYPFIEMDLVRGAREGEGAYDGRKLYDLIKSRPTFPQAARLIILRHLAKAVGALHHQGISHNDLKHDNYLLAPKAAALLAGWEQGSIDDEQLVQQLLNVDRAVILSDLGIASLIKVGELDDPNAPVVDSKFSQVPELREKLAHADGVTAGTPIYRSPEQSNGAIREGSNDVYTWALLAFELLTGERAIDFGDKPAEIAVQYKIMTLQDIQPSAILANDPRLVEVPEEVRDIMSRTSQLQNAWRDRGSIDQVAAELGTYLERFKPEVQEVKKEKVKAQRAKKKAEVAEQQAEQASRGKKRAAGIGGAIALALLTTLGGVQIKNKWDRDAASAAAKANEEARVARERQLAEEREQARLRTEQLIREGDALLAQKNYDAARAKFREAGDTAKLEACDRNECRDSFVEAVSAYKTADQEIFNRKLLSVRSLQYVGLTAEEHQEIDLRAEILGSWSETKATLETEAERIGRINNLQEFQTELQPIVDGALQGDRDKISTLLYTIHYVRYHAPAGWAARVDRGEARQDVADAMRGDGGVNDLYIAKTDHIWGQVYNVNMNLRRSVQNPHFEEQDVEYFKNELGRCISKINTFLRNRDRYNTIEWFVGFFRSMDNFSNICREFQINSDDYVNSNLELVLNLAREQVPKDHNPAPAVQGQVQLPRNLQAFLLSLIEQYCAGNERILTLARAKLNQ